jgi:uncharacterized protein (DUF1697 family)
MPRYVAFLRGVSPLNAKMPELKRCFETAGFQDVRTLLSSGNVMFSSRTAAEATLARKAEKAMHTSLGRTFTTFIRSASFLQRLIEADPYTEFDFPPNAKRVITFLRAAPSSATALPIEGDEARILKLTGAEVFSICVPGQKGSAFMKLLERTFGSDITTRTLDTVKKCAWD